ncbi:hypothetical protein B0H17DRAFT_1145900 [Mycena rosella]|uniref:Uncharacterized protein n=1 Tax=Mycena rosella TaxID=1033263 RepID=A0AAD7G530_MYCRO|nr:hypothetical protein B0H17DRAFT_1145900 [Mycena rosella]
MNLGAWHPKGSTVITAGLKNGVLNTIQLKNNVKWENSVNGSIHCVSFRTLGKLLAVGFNNQVMLACQALPSTWSNEKYIAPPPDFQGLQDITRSVYFHSKENIIIATYLYNGIIAYDTELGAKKWHIDAQALCGDSALSSTSRLLAVTNLGVGIDWYDTGNKKLTYTTPYPSSDEANVLLPVVFIRTNVIAVGSAAGKVTIFKSGNSQALQNLDHHDNMVQALAHFYDDQRKTHVLVTGISEQYDECALTVWVAANKRKTTSQVPSLWHTFLYIGSAAAIGAVLLGRTASVITSSIHLNYIIESGQQLSRKLSNFWLTYKPTSGSLPEPMVAETYTSIVTKTIEVVETTASTVNPDLPSSASKRDHNVMQEHDGSATISPQE